MEGWRVPSGWGTSPVVVKRMMAFSNMATWLSSMPTSTSWPSPVRSRAWRAARIPITVKKAAVMSPIETPTRTGSPPGVPVMLITPPIPWMTIS